jgi:TolA-binding protein
MNNDEKLLQLLDHSACLSKSQLLGYVNRSLFAEEERTVELHLASCTLCSDAVEGFQQNKEALSSLAQMRMPDLPKLPPRTKKEETKANTIPTNTDTKVTAKTITNNNITPKDNTTTPQTVEFKKKQPTNVLGIVAILCILIGASIWAYMSWIQPKTTLEQYTAQQSITTSTADSNMVTAAIKDNLAVTVSTSDSLLLFKAKQEAELLVQQKRRDSLTVAIQRNTLADSVEMIVASAKEIRAEQNNMASLSAEQEDSQPLPESKAEKAEKASAKVAVAAPKTSNSEFDAALKQYKSKNYSEAIDNFKNVTSDKSNAKYWEAVYYTGLSHKALDNKRRARKMFNQIIEAKAPQAKAAQNQLDLMDREKDKD